MTKSTTKTTTKPKRTKTPVEEAKSELSIRDSSGQVNAQEPIKNETVTPVEESPKITVKKEIIGAFKRGQRVIVKKECGQNKIYTSGQVVSYNPLTHLYTVNGLTRIVGLKNRPDITRPIIGTYREDELSNEA